MSSGLLRVRYFSLIRAGSSPGQGMRAMGDMPVQVSGIRQGPRKPAERNNAAQLGQHCRAHFMVLRWSPPHSRPIRSRLRLSAQCVVMNPLWSWKQYGPALRRTGVGLIRPRFLGYTRVPRAGLTCGYGVDPQAPERKEYVMYTLQIEHGIKDFGMWKAAFDRDPVNRAAVGRGRPPHQPAGGRSALRGG